MSKKMLVNAAQAGEVRVAIITDGVLDDLNVAIAGSEQIKGNIYKARVVSVESGLQAAFVDYGAERNGFVTLGDIHERYFTRPKTGNGRPSIQDVLRPGAELLVQAYKEEVGNKGAALTTDITLPGRYLVLMPYGGSGGVSKKIQDEATRRELKELIARLDPPEEMGLIVRTAGKDRSRSELQKDYQEQIRVWGHIQARYAQANAPGLVYREPDVVIRSVRDYFTDEIDEVVTDDAEVYARVREFFVRHISEEGAERVKHYTGKMPLFSNYGLERQIENTASPRVPLPSGGSIVIHTTEALTAIDVNSGKSKGQASQELMAYETNCEAAVEVARQLRLRDVGGLVVVDFIDMNDAKHRRDVERRLKKEMAQDKARVELGRVSRFGLLELSRQRIKARLLSSTHQVCPMCDGAGYVMTTEVAAMSMLRRLQELAVSSPVGSRIRGRLPVEVALHLLNFKRADLRELEHAFTTTIELIPDLAAVSTREAFEVLAPGATERTAESRANEARRDRDRGGRRDRNDRGDRNERGDRGGRGERGDRSDRGDRGGRRDRPQRPPVAARSDAHLRDDDDAFEPPRIVGYIPPDKLATAELGPADEFEPFAEADEPGDAVVLADEPDDAVAVGDGEESEERKRRRRRRRGRDRDRGRSADAPAHMPTADDAEAPVAPEATLSPTAPGTSSAPEPRRRRERGGHARSAEAEAPLTADAVAHSGDEGQARREDGAESADESEARRGRRRRRRRGRGRDEGGIVAALDAQTLPAEDPFSAKPSVAGPAPRSQEAPTPVLLATEEDEVDESAVVESAVVESAVDEVALDTPEAVSTEPTVDDAAARRAEARARNQARQQSAQRSRRGGGGARQPATEEAARPTEGATPVATALDGPSLDPLAPAPAAQPAAAPVIQSEAAKRAASRLRARLAESVGEPAEDVTRYGEAPAAPATATDSAPVTTNPAALRAASRLRAKLGGATAPQVDAPGAEATTSVAPAAEAAPVEPKAPDTEASPTSVAAPNKPKRGRPRKDAAAAAPAPQAAPPQAATIPDGAPTAEAEPARPKRGRPRKDAAKVAAVAARPIATAPAPAAPAAPVPAAPVPAETAPAETVPAKPKRGRPRKVAAAIEPTPAASPTPAAPAEAAPAKPKRGRPRKDATPAASATATPSAPAAAKPSAAKPSAAKPSAAKPALKRASKAAEPPADATI